MKKQFCIILLLFLTSNIYCQQVKKIIFGIKTGAAFAKSKMDYVSNGSSPNIKMKADIMGGVFVNIYLNKNISLQPALLYVPKGGRESIYSGEYYPLRYTYIETPLNIVYKTKASSGTFYFGGGLSPAFRIKSYLFGNDDVKDFDVGINVLAGYMVPLGFSINHNYTYGLLNLSIDKNYASKIQNRFVGVTAGYEF